MTNNMKHQASESELPEGLADRINALEVKYETMRRAVLDWGKDVDAVKRWNDDHLKRIMALESVQQPSRSASLLERVVMAVGRDGETARWEEARAAIRQVAEWMNESSEPSARAWSQVLVGEANSGMGW